MSEPTTTSQSAEQGTADRGSNRSHRPASTAFKNFVMSRWAPRAELGLTASAAAPYTGARRAALSQRLPADGERAHRQASREQGQHARE